MTRIATGAHEQTGDDCLGWPSLTQTAGRSRRLSERLTHFFTISLPLHHKSRRPCRHDMEKRGCGFDQFSTFSAASDSGSLAALSWGRGHRKS